MNKLLVTALMVVFLALAPGPPAPAQTMVEYGGLVSKNPGGGKLGSSLNHKFGSVRNKSGRPKHSKARSWRLRKSKSQARHWRPRKSKPRSRSSRWKSARKM